jgi:hypothetical protein
MVEYIDGRKAHVFECAVRSCHCRSRLVCWFLDTGNAKSTSNLCQHAKVCWGEEAVSAADNTRDVKTARDILTHTKGVDKSITALFQCTAKGKVTYSHCQHTKVEAQ